MVGHNGAGKRPFSQLVGCTGTATVNFSGRAFPRAIKRGASALTS
ncbi:hypothetical protein [Anoxybacterium hadale]